MKRYVNHEIEDASRRIIDEVQSQVDVLGRNSDIQRAIKMYGRIGGSQDYLQTKTGYKHDPSQSDTQKSIVGIFMEDIMGTTETVLQDVLKLPTATIGEILRFFSAHKILMGMLIFSVFVNLFLSGRSTTGYWQQRKAEKFMQKVGVKPNTAIMRMVSLKEIDELVASGLPSVNSTNNGVWLVSTNERTNAIVIINSRNCTLLAT